MKRFIYLFCFLTFSCSINPNKKLDCYNSSLANLKRDSTYKLIMKTFDSVALNIKDKEGFYVFHPEYVKDVLRDQSLFFNTNRSKCLILLLQKSKDDLNVDQVQIIQGTLKNGKWEFYNNRLPAVPQITKTVRKKIIGANSINNTFETLADEGRLFVLSAGNVSTSDCKIDPKYWFNEEN